jgi:hypothetical protein
MGKVTLPMGYTMVEENDVAVLAHNEHKQEYVAWTKDATGGVCWGHYFSYWHQPKEYAYEDAYKAYLLK